MTAVVLAVLMFGPAFLPAGARAEAPLQYGSPFITAIQVVSAAGASPNALGQFTEFRVVVNVTAIGTGIMRVGASLTTANGTTYIASNDTWRPYDGAAGHMQYTVDLAGPLIRHAGFDGPYRLRVFAQSWSSDINTSGNEIDNTTPTPALSALAFAPLWVDLAGPVTYSLPDADQDGLYDGLVAHVPLQVNAAAPLALTGNLFGQAAYFLGVAGAGDGRARFLQPGRTTWDLTFPGYEIRQSRVSGPYTLQLSFLFPFVSPGMGNPQVTYSFPTEAWNYTRFDPSSAYLRGPVTASLAPAGGMPNALEVVHVPLRVRIAGNYTVQANPWWCYLCYGGALQRLYPPTPHSVRDVALPVGDTVVDVPFSSLALARLPAGQNLTLLITVRRIEDFADADMTVWTEHNVTSSLLPTKPTSDVGVMTRLGGLPCPYTQAAAADLTNRFYYANWSWSNPVNPLSANLELYPGTFEIFASGCGASSVRTVTVGGSENLTIDLDPVSAPLDRYTLTFPSWNRSVAVYQGTRLAGPGARFYADLAGNSDGTADATELALYVHQCCVWPFIPALVTLDGSDDFPVTAEVTAVQGAGPVTTTTPVSVTVRYDAPMEVPALEGPTHNVLIKLYTSLNAVPPYELEIRLPSQVTGNLTTSAMAWSWSSISAPSNVTVQALGPGAWDLTPGGPPPGYPRAWPYATLVVNVPGSVPTGSAGGLETALIPVLVFAAGLVAGVALFVAVFRPSRGRARKPPRSP